MEFPDLAPVADRAALFAGITKQMMGEHLDRTLGDYRWDVGLPARTLNFSATEVAPRSAPT